MSLLPSFDPVIHAPLRLQICAVLSAAQEVEFATLRDTLEVSDSVLSKHLKQLDEARYVRMRKAPRDGRVYTWIALTGAGRHAFAAHIRALEQLAATVAPEPVTPAE